MQLRRLISVMAMFGVLLHAGLLVRHSVSMTAAGFEHAALQTSLSTFCHGGGGVSQLPAAETPDLPQPSNTGGDCPICSGVCGAAVVLPAVDAYIATPDRTAEKIAARAEILALRKADAWPPSRGPPARG
jgi:Protein of unknown function (DUF2946)